ncbi:MAG: type II secretion system GspH family protein [Acidimicrobiia bacterium]|nr:type II secretion system GspH family protein [Acidimicrobiia bacterium]
MHTSDRRDGGFTLIEAAVALLIASFIFVALGQTIAWALRSAEERRLEQQGAALTAEVVEAVRDLEYDQVALLPDAADPTRLPASSYDPGTGPEPLIEDSLAGIPNQVTKETFNSVTYTLTRYVTWVDDNPLDSQTEDYRRLSVVAEWESRGVKRTEELQTFVARQSAEGGASNPTYGPVVGPPSLASYGAAGTDVVFEQTVTNIGNRDDTFDMTVTNDAGWPVTLLDATTGFPLVDTSGNGIPDTGNLLPAPDAGSTLGIRVVVSIPDGTPFRDVSSTIVEATSVVDPDMSASASDKTVSTGPFTAVNAELYLKSGMALQPSPPTGLPSLVAGPDGTTFTWSTPVPAEWTLITDGTLDLYVGRRGTCAAADVAYAVTVRTTSETWALGVPSGPIAVSGCGVRWTSVDLPINGNTIAAGETLYVDITITEVTSGTPAKRGLSIGFDGLNAESQLTFRAIAS